MSNGTGENEMGLQKITGFIRNASILILLLHFYYYCYDVFAGWKLEWNITNRFLLNLARTGLFIGYNAKLVALGLLILSLIGSKGRKDENFKWQPIVFYLLLGLSLFLFSHQASKYLPSKESIAIVYMTLTIVGYLLIL